MPIHKLDSRTANQIAAGEVVENPASVVKELVENALDAGARRIKIAVKSGGLEEISVTDDGCGILKADLRLALQRHATSKISRIEDLETITSLGFRGEALPSIASVSRLTLSTKHPDEEVGNQIVIEGGRETDFQEQGLPPGTRVTIKELFFNTPVRKKFLKSVTAETARLTKIVQNLALSRPDVAFSLERNRQPVLHTPGDGDIFNAILSIYGQELGSQLVSLDDAAQDTPGACRLQGFISQPKFSRNNRNYQLFFVNRRYVQSRLMGEELDLAFSRVVTSRRFPMAFLFLSLPPGEIDVNVHPTKTEIRFHRGNAVRSFLRKALQEGFSSRRPYELPGQPAEQNAGEDKEAGEAGRTEEAVPSINEQQHFSLMETRPDPNATVLDQLVPYERVSPVLASPDQVSKAPGFFDYDLLLGQLFHTYILIQQENRLLFIDQHAAHERIIWEQMEQTGHREQLKQQIIPQAVELSPAIVENVAAAMDLFAELGLELEQFGDRTFIIRTVPVFIRDRVTGELLQDILEAVTRGPANDLQAIQNALLTQISCKGSVKARQKLSREEMESLLQQLKACQQPFYCPHGRPVVFQLEEKEIEKQFKRRS